MNRSTRMRSAILLLALVMTMLFSGFTVTDLTFPAVEEPENYEKVTIYLDGILTEEIGYVFGREAYMSVEAFAQLVHCEYVGYTYEDGVYSAEFNGLELNFVEDTQYIVSEGRYLYAPDGVKSIYGEFSLPLSALSKLSGSDLFWDHNTHSIDIDTTDMLQFESAENFYDEDDLYWLSRIINAESRDQSFEGKIGVGNTVLNRVGSASFPSEVYDVIFDSTYGVQFSPTETGSIYNEPSEEAVAAAKVCLEGYNVVGDSLYFVNPDIGVSSWFSETRSFVSSIGDHDFYS